MSHERVYTIDRVPTFERQTLANGLRVLTAPMPHAQSVSCFVMLAAGSRYETPETNGIAHFAEHMFFKGTERRPTAQDIAGEIDAIGGEFNAFTGKEYTGYYVKCAAEHRPIATDVLVDMLRRSKSPAAQKPSSTHAIPTTSLSHQTPVRSESATMMSMIPVNRNMKPVIEAIATNVFSGWMNDRIPPTTSSTPRIAFSAFHQPPLTTAVMANSKRPAIRKMIPASTPIDFADVISNRNMISARNSQAVPVIRKTHQRGPKLSS